MKLPTILVAVVVAVAVVVVVADVSRDAQLLTKKWAPLIWLHPEEKFFPVTPEFHITNMEVGAAVKPRFGNG
jgi:hypothetical protein